MFDIIDYSTAERIKPVLTLSLEALSKIMENPEEFLANGYWTVSTEFPIPEKANLYDTLFDSLTDDEEKCHNKWVKSWLNTHGWDITEDLSKVIPFPPAPTGENQ